MARKLHNTRRLVVAAALLVALVTAGCGKEQPDLVNGKKLFIGDGTCGTCHALQRAGTKVQRGPNLDQAFANARKSGFGDSAIAGVVRNQIAHPRRGSIMKPHLVKGDDARDVAAYVGKVAGKGGEDTGLLATAGTPDYKNKTAVAKAGKLTIPADPGGSLAFQFGKATAPAGPITISMPNPSKVPHNIAITGPVKGAGPIVNGGGDSTFKVTLKPGNYKFLCEVQGHAAAGMMGDLVVK